MRSIWIAIAIAACATGCKKKAKEPPKPPEVAWSKQPQPKPEPPPPLKPLPPATDGPVYASIQSQGVLRFDAEGWKLIGNPADSVRLELGVDGTLWAWDAERVWKLDGETFTQILSDARIIDAAGASDGTLWIISKGELRHYGLGGWTTETVPGGDPPRGVAADAEGIWIHTLDRTYDRSGTSWLPFDVPGVTGEQADILSLASNGREQFLVSTGSVMIFEKSEWRLVRAHAITGEWAIIIPGPAGRFALTSARSNFLGDSARGGRGLMPLDVGPTNVTDDYVHVAAVDDRGRSWATAYRSLAVFDENGKMLRQWTGDDLPLFKGIAISVVVGRGGPAGLSPGERMVGKVTGKVEGSAAGMTVRVCTQSQAEYNKEPCEGIGNSRNATTIDGGKFTLDGVSIGPMYFWVKRGTRWRSTAPVECCAQLAPDGTVDVGTLTLR
jgi:hypothetical protein